MKKPSHSRLFYKQYASKLTLESKFVISVDFPVGDTEPLRHILAPQWRNLTTPMRYAFESKTPTEATKSWVSTALIDVFARECAGVIDFYRDLISRKDSFGKFTWSVDPGYARRQETVIAFKIRFNLYFKGNDSADRFVEGLKENLTIQLFDDYLVSNLSDSAMAKINDDPNITVVKKYPWGKYTGKIWLSFSKLSALSQDQRQQVLRTLKAYEDTGIIRCQPAVKKFLGGLQNYIWNDVYIYTDDESIKNVLDLVLVNIITRYERMVLENG